MLVVVYLYTDAYPMSLGFDVGPAEPNPFIGGQLWPEVLRERAQGLHLFAIAIPLWLLAFICLAWPVTSFILARRRHKRGFPVEPTAGGEAVSPRASSS